ncbi:MAG TPA: alpha/beta fold hydrolase [Anaerolineae bacterium]|nr:alpha/beta fold hydrolase [Anaerolineae bacterium]
MQIDLELYRSEVLVSDRPRVRLSAIDIHPEAARRTLVFIHGFGGRARQWVRQLTFFSAENRAVALDLRGHGQSDAPHSSYSMDEIQSDLDVALERLRVYAPGKFVLVGHSFGGAIASEYAARHPDRLDRLVLIATAGEFSIYAWARFLLRLPEHTLRPIRKAVRRSLSAPPHVLKAWHNNNLSKWSGWDVFGRIQVPTLVITGHRDRVFPNAAFDEVPRRIPGAQHVTIPISAHMVMIERADAVNRAIARFVDEPDGKRSFARRAATPREKLLERRPWLKHYEPGVPFTVAIPDRPVHRFLRSAAQRFPGHTAIRFLGAKMSYRQLSDQADRFGNAMRGLGVDKGDRVLLLLPNLPQTVIAYFGALRAGAVVVFASPTNSDEEIIRQANDSGAKVLVTLTRFGDLGKAILAGSQVEHVVFANVKDYLPRLRRAAFSLTREGREGHRLAFDLEPGMHRWNDLLWRYPPVRPGIEPEPDDVALVIYTGGTTDRPKGVMLSHRNLVANAIQTRHWISDAREGRERFLCVLPFSHIYGLTTALNVPVMLGATMIILPTFQTREVLETIRATRPTMFTGVPTMYMAISNYPGVRRYGIRSIRACISGAAPLPVEVQEAFEKLTRGRLVEGYGLTEASPVTHGNPLNGLRKVGSIGIPFPNTDAKIVDLATGEDLPPGHIGELAVRGPQVMLSYWGMGDESDRVLRDGWLYTGDIAVKDEDGYFTIINRKKEMILAGEYQVYPRDIEEVLFEHPKVKDVAVVGVPATPPGQKVKAFVVLREGESATPDELIALCRQRLDAWAVPWEVEFRRELPKSFVGKVLRRVLVEEEGGDQHG